MPDNLDQNLKKQITALEKSLNQLERINQENIHENKQYGQIECSRIINNFKKELLMKPGTTLVKVNKRTILKEDDVIIYQLKEHSHYKFGFFKNNQEWQDKDIFTFADISQKQQENYAFATSIESSESQIVTDPNDELMLVEINKENLGDLERSHKTETGEMYAPIVIKSSDCFKIGRIVFLPNTLQVEVDGTSVSNDTRYFTFISELEYNEQVRIKFQENNPFNVCPYNMVISIK